MRSVPERPVLKSVLRNIFATTWECFEKSALRKLEGGKAVEAPWGWAKTSVADKERQEPVAGQPAD